MIISANAKNSPRILYESSYSSFQKGKAALTKCFTLLSVARDPSRSVWF